MKAIFRNFLKDVAIIIGVTILIGAMSYFSYDYTVAVHLGTGLASAGAFVFVFLGFPSVKGFMNKT